MQRSLIFTLALIFIAAILILGLIIRRQQKKAFPLSSSDRPPTAQYPAHPKNLRYKTNYYQMKATRLRESPRSKAQRKGEIGEYKVEVQLEKLPAEYRLLSNLLLNTEKGMEQIDHLLISPFGVFILEVKNLSGLIVGEEDAPHWHQSITWRVKAFRNPLIENETHIQTLRILFQWDEKVPFYSFVTFNRRCDLKVISGSVFYDTDILAALLKKPRQAVLTEAEVQSLYERISQANIQEQSIRKEYAAQLHKQRLGARPKYGDIRCVGCQKPVTERVARYCLTHPEKFAYQIYCVKHQKEIHRISNTARIKAEQIQNRNEFK